MPFTTRFMRWPRTRRVTAQDSKVFTSVTSVNKGFINWEGDPRDDSSFARVRILRGGRDLHRAAVLSSAARTFGATPSAAEDNFELYVVSLLRAAQIVYAPFYFAYVARVASIFDRIDHHDGGNSHQYRRDCRSLVGEYIHRYVEQYYL